MNFSERFPWWLRSTTWEETFRQPAMSVLPFLRRDLGARTLQAGGVYALAVLMFFAGVGLATFLPHFDAPLYVPPPDVVLGNTVNPWDPLQVTPYPANPPYTMGAVSLFAVAMFCAAVWQDVGCWRRRRRGIVIHSYSWGFSRIPFFAMKHGRRERLIDPLACLVVGVGVWQTFSPALGLWLVLACFSLHSAESDFYQAWQTRVQDAVDASLEGEYLSDAVQDYTRGGGNSYGNGHTVFETDKAEFIHTTLAPDVEALIARRKRPKAGCTPSRSARARVWLFKAGRRLWVSTRERVWLLGCRLWTWWTRRRGC